MAADYERAASAAAGVLLSKGVGFDLAYAIVTDPAARLIRYTRMADRMLCRSTAAFIARYAESEYSYTKYDPRAGIYYILYNDANLLEREIRSHLAHEYAHVLLRHTRGDGNTDEENEANCCARLYTCPAPLADALGVRSPRDYMTAFGVDEETAFAAKRFRETDRDTLNALIPDLTERSADRLALAAARLSRGRTPLRAAVGWPEA